MAYDTMQQKIIAFGGRTGFPDFQVTHETWAFDYNTSTWINMAPESSPPWRGNHAMVYDSYRNKILMFGGSDFSQVFNDLWQYDVEQNLWIELASTSPPPARQMHGLVYVPEQDSLFLFGGRQEGGGAYFEDTWQFEFATNRWHALVTDNRPPVSDHVNLAYDNAAAKLILFSRPDASVLANGRQSTWAYDFATGDWSNLNPVSSPDSGHSSFVYDPYHQKLVLFGDSSSARGMFTWTFNTMENTWTNITPPSFPDINYIDFPAIEHDGMVYIDDHNVFIQYGGCCSDTTLKLILDK
jgi:N-acetylneuraminic acid mutarotase